MFRRVKVNKEIDTTFDHDLKSEEDMLHLAMHNILLQGIIGHMDLNEVFKKVHKLVKNFKEFREPGNDKGNYKNSKNSV